MTERLHPQLEALGRELGEATARARQLSDRLGDAAFGARPAGGGWSPAECLMHLSLSARAFLPFIDEALANAATVRLDPARHYRKDPVGWLLTTMLEPPVRMKVKTPQPFVPATAASRDEVVREFERCQGELLKRLSAANDTDIGRVKVRSPFSSRMRYNLLATFSVIAAHERRHLWQAERAARAGSSG